VGVGTALIFLPSPAWGSGAPIGATS